MIFGSGGSSGRFKWHFFIIYVAVIVAVLFTFFTSILQTPEGVLVPQIIWLLGALIFLIAILAILAKILKIVDIVSENNSKLDKISGTLEKNRAVLTQINQNVQLSEAAKTIAFRDADRQALRDAVFDKLHQQDFDATYEVIDEIAHSTSFKELAKQLHIEADKYRDATDAERINQVIAHIEKLFDNHDWARASSQIERLIKAAPDSERAKAMRQKLLDKKQERKKVLLNAWDDAVRRQATDRSLEILKELDPYLTPNEGLALQEAARDIFRNKLHNLGVQFSLAISGKQWARALQTGQQITRDFPNSRMAEEIREKWAVLKQKVQQQG